jgi:cell wall-associated NlpC family hydrolase
MYVSRFVCRFIGVVLISSFGPVWAEEPNRSEERQYAVVTVCTANMRVEPRHAAEMATQCPLGTPLLVRERRSGWYAVTTPEKYQCWVTADSIDPMTKTEFNQWIEAPKVIFLENYGTVRLAPSDNSAAVSDITAGCVAVNGEKKGGYIQISFPDDRTGFILQDDCTDFETWKRETKPTADSIVTMAKELMGVAYLWGGTSPKMLDCSGLTKHCFFMNGIIIPRNASQQAKIGQSIDMTDGLEHLVKGDLLFFGSPNRVTHVGIYIEEGLFIHEAGRVRLNNLLPGTERYSRSSARSLVRVCRFVGVSDDPEIVSIAEHPLYRLQP